MDKPNIIRGVVFRERDSVGLDRFEVCVSEDVITMNADQLPDDMTEWQARCVAEMLLAAAVELGE
ncbi:hypothetical protein [Luteimonas saliphila]|uniref:hypothetical protein n=1 Tax=Luteimonas saliphila TaxID=2804919 RepID=UPI00192DF28A|nr:hypothetical protein [Luteimonas saliphila]